jgi:ribonuclease HI
MELFAAIEGLRALKRASQVTVLTDSEYVRRGITEFLPRWKANGWRASTGKPVVNRDLWEELEELAGYPRGDVDTRPRTLRATESRTV